MGGSSFWWRSSSSCSHEVIKVVHLRRCMSVRVQSVGDKAAQRASEEDSRTELRCCDAVEGVEWSG